MEKAFKYRIYPNKKQQELIQKTFGCCRFVYNYFLDKRKSEYGKDKTSLSYNDTSKLLTKLKQELVWLKEPDKDSLQKSLKDLDMAYQKFSKSMLVIQSSRVKRTDTSHIEPVVQTTTFLFRTNILSCQSLV